MKLLNVSLALAALTLIAVPAFAVTINEIRIDQDGTDYDEYFELAGQPGESLDGLTYIVIGDGTLGNGSIESVTPLDGYSIAGDGYFLCVESIYSDTCGDAPDLALPGENLGFENSDNVTHMLVAGFSGSLGDDIDTDDDWVIDNPLWNEIIDSIALVESPGTGDAYYGDVTLGPDGIYVPGHAFVCGDDWFIGDFTLCVHDTPGLANSDACAVPNETTSFGDLKSLFR